MNKKDVEECKHGKLICYECIGEDTTDNKSASVVSSAQVVRFNCRAAQTILEVLNRNLEAGATSSPFSDMKHVIELLEEALPEA